MRILPNICVAIALISLIASSSFAGEVTAHFTGWVQPSWVNPNYDVEGEVRIIDIEQIDRVEISFAYPNGATGKTTAKSDKAEATLFHFSIPAQYEAGLGEMTYSVEVSHGDERTTSAARSITMGYEEDLEITANPPEILWFPLGDKSATVRYTACCNILGASIIAKRTPVNPMESSKGLPDVLYSDFISLEPDALAASTAGLYFEFGFKPEDFKEDAEKFPVILEYDWMDKEWTPVTTFDVVDGKVLDFPATEGGVYVLAKR